MVALSVAVIGGGPGGMLFCHALETRRRVLMEQGDDDDDAGLANLPTVTCFERAPAPGGVWRSERTFVMKEEKKESEVVQLPTTNMYEALWTNGPKENIEFFDYTFDEHFGGHAALPVYMPRQPVLEYMVGRVTKHCPDFFDKYMKFNTNVESVRHDEITSKFEIVTRNVLTGREQMEQYDKCIWAGGENGRPKMPTSMTNMLRSGGFAGRIIHSSDSASFESDVKGKRILMIGGNYSAEDLALMAIKVNADKVYVSSRNKNNAISWTKAWPHNIVEFLQEQIPVRVTENGQCIQFSKAEWAFPDICIPGENVETEIRDVDTIIFCTGYLPNLDMLDTELRQAATKDVNLKLPVPEEWKMKQNALTAELGDVAPEDVRWINSSVTYPHLYRGLSIDNPHMMFITTDLDNPLHGIDVCCWLLLRFITGSRKIPSKEEMVRQNEQDALIPMNNPFWRYWMDKNYFEAFNAKFSEQSRLKEFESEHADIYMRFLARAAQEAEYPLSFGTFDELNETAKTIMKHDWLSYDHRAKLTAEDAENRRTFRDCKDSGAFRSIFTGTQAAPLKCLWLDIADADDESIITQ